MFLLWYLKKCSIKKFVKKFDFKKKQSMSDIFWQALQVTHTQCITDKLWKNLKNNYKKLFENIIKCRRTLILFAFLPEYNFYWKTTYFYIKIKTEFTWSLRVVNEKCEYESCILKTRKTIKKFLWKNS